MPKKIKDENGNEVEVYSQEELDQAKKAGSDEARKAISDKLGVKEGEDFDKTLDSTIERSNKRIEFEKVRDGKEKTKQKAQEEILKQLKEKGIDAKIDEKTGQVVIDTEKQNQNNSGLSAEDAQKMMDQTILNNKYKEEKTQLLSSLDEEKRADVEAQMTSLKNANVEGDTKQIFNMALAALGVDTPKNMDNSRGGYPNGSPENQGGGDRGGRGGDFANTPEGRTIQRNLGMSDEQIAEGEKLKDQPRMIQEGRITNDGGRVANQHDNDLK